MVAVLARMNHSEEFGRANWAGADMPVSWRSPMAADNSVLVCDNGTGFVKVGFAGSNILAQSGKQIINFFNMFDINLDFLGS